MSVEIEQEKNSTTKRAPKETRRRLMDAAVKLFAEKGRDGTTIDDICQSSGVSRRMIYHYFGSKDGLYMAMLEEVYGRMREFAIFPDERSQSLSEYIEMITERYFRFLQANPEFVAVLRWENASGAEGLRQLDLDGFRNQYVEAARQTLDRIPDQRESTEMSLTIVLTCCSLCGHYFSNQATMSKAFGIELEDSEFAEKWLIHIKKMAVSYFCD